MITAIALAALVAAAPAPAEPTGAASSPAPEQLNALALENGAVLTADGGSYATGVSEWSAWNLTNGDEKSGWCSPKGKPSGLAFVWELDTSWKLGSLAISTRNLQERGYPGISARVVELWLDSGGGFSRVGAFEVGKDTRKEFQLPAGTGGWRSPFRSEGRRPYQAAVLRQNPHPSSSPRSVNWRDTGLALRFMTSPPSTASPVRQRLDVPPTKELTSPAFRRSRPGA